MDVMRLSIPVVWISFTLTCGSTRMSGEPSRQPRDRSLKPRAPPAGYGPFPDGPEEPGQFVPELEAVLRVYLDHPAWADGRPGPVGGAWPP
ncbi:hypothetical protein DMB38_35990 [Streptomyces sp. WAC 06738]|uniref:hypothetical protein n=1 Tax=Streptomyces sp. WAC 06738 TaxID=2203210 RepID=UPI000F71980A|nr:hypothetical protein [Streptomyces sp. WAC 06738]AZM44424.1 hypothetical protein DMB38_00035 [Streptomyces sp. WAC 06738]AZM50476.1 hypothetical protein DMB38_35990 [Streptomyces sp. WAC 06738]